MLEMDSKQREHQPIEDHEHEDREPPALHILFVSDSIREPLTGVGRTALAWMRELVELGAQITALDHEPNPTAESVCGKCLVQPIRGRWLPTARWHLSLLRRIEGLGVEHDVLFDPTGYPNAWGHHRRQAVVAHDLSMFSRNYYRRGKRWWFRLFYGRALRKAQLCVCVSEHTRRELLGRFDLPPSRCVVVPNCVDPAFARGLAQSTADRAGSPPYFLAVGTIENRKNTGRLLEAFAAAQVPHRLVLAGRPGHGGEEILARAASLGERILVAGDVEDAELFGLYKGATALLFPSLEEGFGIPILEAMQAGIPVLTSNVSAMPEVAGDAALLVDPLDVNAIQKAIERLAGDADLRTDLVRRGAKRLAAFDIRTNAEALLGHLRRLSGTGSEKR